MLYKINAKKTTQKMKISESSFNLQSWAGKRPTRVVKLARRGQDEELPEQEQEGADPDSQVQPIDPVLVP